MSNYPVKLETPEQFKAAIEHARVRSGKSLRGVASSAETGHATYWAWTKKPDAEVSLRTALAFAKAVGLTIFATIGE